MTLLKAPQALMCLLLAGLPVHAALSEPYIAVGQGYKCGACHVNPTGGGLRNSFGVIFAENVLPAHGLPAEVPVWTGSIADVVRLGADLRASWSLTDVPHQKQQRGWKLDQLRVYGDLEIIKDHLGLYVDEALAPGSARNLEAYLRYTDPGSGLYVKAGQFYLPFGWRLQDNTAFVREVSGISMTTPDNGVEVGLERGDWSASLDVTNGAANAGAGSGYQLTGQLVRVRPTGRIGVATSFTNSDVGDRMMAGLFAGIRTGPLVWLGEADIIRDDSYPGGRRSLLAGLAEVNWGVFHGHNLKLTAEYFDPDRDISEDQKTRYSLLYEYTPFPFVQLRAGFRRYRGIPQNDHDNRSLTFLEVHGFF